MIRNSELTFRVWFLTVLFNSSKFKLNPSGIYTMNFIYVDRRE